MTTIIEAVGLTKRFGSTMALDDVSLRVTQGVSVGVIGESGSGKTTLMKTLLGVIKPDAGAVTFAGQPITTGGFGMRPWRRDMQVVLQDPYSSLTPSMRIDQILAEPVRLLQKRRPAREELATLLDEVGLPGAILSRHPHQLSGGQRQRVAIARALSVSPKVLIADEPVSALDVSVRAELLTMLERLIVDRGLTLIVVSHDLGVVQRMCPHTVVMASGAVVEEGPTLRLLTQPRHPITRALLEAVPRIDTTRST